MKGRSFISKIISWATAPYCILLNFIFFLYSIEQNSEKHYKIDTILKDSTTIQERLLMARVR